MTALEIWTEESAEIEALAKQADVIERAAIWPASRGILT